METVRIKTTGMHCQSCTMIIEMNVGDLPGVEEVDVSLADGVAEVTFDPSQVGPDAIVKEIKDAGYQAEVLA
ncbi:MAG: heavy-metal-associated domain-containing protein [Coriobacteriales bacterium]|nr:heavy-metal-associated domain-containing protein [Coriobacteriales bacterium]